MVSSVILFRRKVRREKNFAELKAENVRLKKIVVRERRKSEHKCIDTSCSLCDPEQLGDGTWEFSS